MGAIAVDVNHEEINQARYDDHMGNFYKTKLKRNRIENGATFDVEFEVVGDSCEAIQSQKLLSYEEQADEEVHAYIEASRREKELIEERKRLLSEREERIKRDIGYPCKLRDINKTQGGMGS